LAFLFKVILLLHWLLQIATPVCWSLRSNRRFAMFTCTCILLQRETDRIEYQSKHRNAMGSIRPSDNTYQGEQSTTTAEARHCWPRPTFFWSKQ